MKHLFFLFSLIFCTSFAQSNTEGISYLHDLNESYTTKTIASSTDFTPLKEDINNGLKNGVYWFKIVAKKVSNKRLTISNSHILKGEVYIAENNKKNLPLKEECHLSFSIPKVHKPIYLKIIAEREAYIPIRIQEEASFIKEKFKITFMNGVFYGITIIIFILNIFYFIHFKDLTFYYYLFTLIVLTMVQGFLDGTFNLFFTNTTYFKYIEIINLYCMTVVSYYFASTYLELDFYMPKNKRISIILLLLLLPFVICYLIFDENIYFMISKIFLFVILGMYIFCGFLLFKSSTFAKFFCLAYSGLFITSLEYLIANDLGFYSTSVNPVSIKIGGAIEMLLISYAVVYRMKELKEKNELMRIEILEYAQKINLLKEEESGDVIQVKEVNLSEQEVKIIKAINVGLTNKEIAQQLDISVNTVKYHTKKIYTKLQVHSRKEIKAKTLQLS